ncbi:hypothetical protein GF325_13455 [Candidatus Bathyarchaeota archaeon]|nr:hypothetical protein [Candidatus Bathyarchaeota archaeon]
MNRRDSLSGFLERRDEGRRNRLQGHRPCELFHLFFFSLNQVIARHVHFTMQDFNHINSLLHPAKNPIRLYILGKVVFSSNERCVLMNKKLKQPAGIMLMLAGLFLFHGFHESSTRDFSTYMQRNIEPSIPHVTIEITGENWTNAVLQGICTGNGSRENPYIIENYEIDGQNLTSCIQISQSNAYFIIQNCTLFGIGANGSGSAGIRLTNVSNGIVHNNTFQTNEVDNYGIHLMNGSHYNILTQNTASGFEYGIFIYNNCSWNIIANNTLYNNQRHGYYSLGEPSQPEYNVGNQIIENNIYNNSENGIQITRAREFCITGNDIRDNLDGIETYRADFGEISYNSLRNNTWSGILCSSYSDGNVIYSNNASNNNYRGICLRGASDNLVSKNHAINNTEYGICLIFGGSDYSFNNTVYKNIVSGSNLNAYEQDQIYPTDNRWNLSNAGNYWGDYGGADGDGDGVGDTPYNITEIDHVADYMPLTETNLTYDGGPIAIDGDGVNGLTWEYASTRWWCDGNGTRDNPYRIADLMVNGRNASEGIYIEDSTAFFTIENCTVFNSSGSGIYSAGIEVYLAHNGTIRNNTVLNNGFEGYSSVYGIVGFFSHEMTISNNIISNNTQTGITLSHCDYLNVTANTIFDNGGYGIGTQSCDFGVFKDNTVENHTSNNGIDFTGMWYCEVINNVIQWNGDPGPTGHHGIDLFNCYGNNFTGNYLNDNDLYNINLWSNNVNNTFWNNTFWRAQGVASAYETNNNNSNFWNNTEIGNVWWAYGGPDADDDGIGDIALNISGSGPGIDYLPIYEDGFNGSAIYIDDTASNNWEWAKTRTWLSGSGNSSDPYMIKDLVIDAGGIGSCIHVSNSRVNFIIENCTLNTSAGGSLPSNYNGGIALDNTTNGELRFNLLEDNNGAGIYANNSSAIVMSNNIMSGDNQYGIYMFDCIDIEVKGNNITDAMDTSMHIDYSNGTWIHDNVVKFSHQGILVSGGDECMITNNTVTNMSSNGIISDDSWNCSIIENEVASITSHGIYIYNSNNAFVDANNVSNAGFYTIFIEYSISCNVTGNKVHDSLVGCMVLDSDTCIVGQNLVWDITNGIYLQRSVETLVIGNFLYNASNNGMWLIDDTHDSIIKNNTFQGNVNYGLYLSGTSGFNTIFGNQFLGNGQEAADDSIGLSNSFYNATETGNYWITYAGEDADDDGIGEQGHSISGSANPVDILPIWWDAPEFSFVAPLENELYSAPAPLFNITITSGRGDYLWYEIDGTGVNSTPVPLPGVLPPSENNSYFIDQGLWDLAGNGTHDITFYINDSQDWTGSQTITVEKDIIAPLVTINAPANGTTVNTLPFVNITAIDANLAILEYRTYSSSTGWINTSINNNTNEPFSNITWNMLTDGPFEIHAYAMDSMGNVNFSEQVNLIKDEMAPLVEIVAPVNATTWSTAPFLHVNAFDISPLGGLYYTMEGSDYAISNATPTQLDPGAWGALASDTAFTIQLTAVDSVGNINATISLDLYKDSAPPVMSITSPSPGQIIGWEAPTFDVTVTDSHLQNTWYRVFNGTTSSTNWTFTYGVDTTIEQSIWDVVGNGSVTIRFHANDSVGNEQYSDMTVYKDIIAPEVFFHDPMNGTEWRVAPALKVSAFDPNLAMLEYWVFSASTGWNSASIANDSLIPLDPGIWAALGNEPFSIHVNASDAAGNRNLSIHLDLIKDTIAPSINIHTPGNLTWFDVPPALNISVHEENSIDGFWYSIGGETYPLVNGSNTLVDATAWNDLPDEIPFTILIRANDSAGNVNDTFSLELIKDAIAPNITILDPLPNTIMGQSAPSFSINVMDYGLHSTWYQVLNGTTSSSNHTFTYGVDTTIEQSIWDVVGNGSVTIRFHANDSLGHESHEDVNVSKNIYDPVITIIDPIVDMFFGIPPPSFVIEIDEENLNETWYTLDDGLSNHSFTGNGSIDTGAWTALDDGPVTIIFYANNTEGNTGETSVAIHKDGTPPIILVNSPNTNDEFSNPPFFEIEYVEMNIESMWYSIKGEDGPWTNVTFTGTTGTINESIWESLTPGQVTIQFSIQDQTGAVDVTEIIIIKESPRSPFGFDQPWVYLIIGLVAVAISVIAFAAIRASKKSRRLLHEKEEELKQLKEQRAEITEGDIMISKEQHVCLVHKGKIEGYSFICPSCGAYYCADCVQAIKEIENTCWSCKAPLDKNKKITPSSSLAEDEPKIDEMKGNKLKKAPDSKAPHKLDDHPRDEKHSPDQELKQDNQHSSDLPDQARENKLDDSSDDSRASTTNDES